jgi:integrase
MGEVIVSTTSVNNNKQVVSPLPETRNDGRFTATRRPPKIYFEASPCEGPGCKNILPAGYYAPQRSRSFCSQSCANRDAGTKYMIGNCLQCGGPIMGRKDKAGLKKFCCNDHKLAFETERILGPTGPFRPLIEEYMRSGAISIYRSGTLPNVRVSLGNFFRFVAQIEKISTLAAIKPPVITRFIVHEHERGLSCRNFVGHLSTFFRWLIAEQRFDQANPVIPRIHSQRGAPAAPRPYPDSDLAVIRATVEKIGDRQLMLAFALGEECGLRIGEVCNLRLSDFDTIAQRVFIRLPTKNMRTRRVPYHNGVKKFLALWLEQRDPCCPTDHVLHNQALHRHTGSRLDARFKKHLDSQREPSSTFLFHRLRHSWATRLMNNGMEIAVLKELGGWESWSSMQRYIAVLDSTVRSQYESAYRRIQEHVVAAEEESISLMDFALIEDRGLPTSSASAA